MNKLIHYIDSLKILQVNNIRFAVTGTFALYLQNKNFASHYILKDCDIFIEYNQIALSSFIKLMQQKGWTCTIWEEKIELKSLMSQAESKYYIRCRKDDLIVDATYEYEADKYGDMTKDLVYVEDLPMIRADKIIEGKKYRANERDLLAVSVFENLSST